MTAELNNTLCHFSDVGISDLEQGYCFLENILDFNHPEENCYEDVAWSEVDGRFWSNIACVEEHSKPQGIGVFLYKYISDLIIHVPKFVPPP